MKIKKILLYFTALSLLLTSLGYASFNIFTPPRFWFNNIEQFLSPLSAQHSHILCSRPNNTPVTALKQTSMPNEINLLVWNIHKGQDSGWQEKLKRLVQKRDIALLQEVSAQQSLYSLFADHYPFQLFAAAFAFLNQPAGVAMLSSIKPESYCLTAQAEPWLRLPKVAMAEKFSLANGEMLLVVNLHLVNFEWHSVYYQQQLNDVIEMIAKHKGPLIIAGDFNSWNAERIKLISQLAQQYALTIVDFTPDIRKRFNGYPLDQVLLRDIEVITATTMETRSSDHNPLLLSLRIKNN